MRRIGLILITLAVAAGLAAAVLTVRMTRFVNEPLVVPEEGFLFEIPPGMAFAGVSDRLAASGVIDQPDLLRWYARLTGQASAVRAGEYLIAAGTTPRELLRKFVDGSVKLYSFTIVEGWNVRELLDALAAHESIDHGLTDEDWPAVLETLAADAGHPEGLFLPETYHFPKGTSDIELLRQAHQHMQAALDEEWQNRASGLPIADPYEALILASIVEKETARADERARIAGVFTRRLEQGMRLQTDPTVIYGVGADFDGNLTRRHLNTDTPYNTYTRRGLPPTPIALPGRAAINAALNPTPGTELYFVATGLGDGSHKFSTTKDEHDTAVREYLARQRAARRGQQ